MLGNNRANLNNPFGGLDAERILPMMDREVQVRRLHRLGPAPQGLEEMLREPNPDRIPEANQPPKPQQVR